jgi:glycosyltransferase involved in cell wall biosynthesis
MRVLAHIHTMNDAAVIEQLLDGLRRQTRPPDGIVIVDNASTDATLDRTFPDGAAVIRNATNLGTSGAIRMGFAYALERHFDWVWVFDADSVPEHDALEKLLAFFDGLPPSEQERVCFLACRLENAEGEVRQRPMRFTDSAIAPVEAAGGYVRCDYFIWTGALFRLRAVARIGLPSADYVLDAAEVEYGYRAGRLGLASYVVNGALTQQDVGRAPGVVVTRTLKIGRFDLAFREVSAIRTYYACRNWLYFWLYQCRPLRPRGIISSIVSVLLFPTNFVLEPVSHRRQLIAYFRGVWDGLTGHMERRY